MNQKAFTLVELLMTIAIAVVLGVVVFASYSGKKNGTDLSSTTQEIVALLHQAQSRTVAGDQNGTTGNGFWGVELINGTGTVTPFFSLFYATSTARLASASLVGHYFLPGTVSYTTSSIAAGGTLNVYYSNGLSAGGNISPGVYELCNGYTCPVGTSTIIIGLYMPFQKPVLSSTISILPTGEVSY
jgi:prepilin-type N-terminal cleavage/methylation domain-containing protein